MDGEALMADASFHSDDPYERLEAAAKTILIRQSWERSNRLGLLAAHAFIGFFGGFLILVNGSAVTFDALGVKMRVLTGVLSLTGGAALALGLAKKPRSIPLEVTGLVLLGIWDVVMTAGFIYATFAQGTLAYSWPWVRLPDDVTARLYPVALYLGMLTLIGIHLWTLKKLRASELAKGGAGK